MAIAPHRRVVKATFTVLIFWTLMAIAYSATHNLPMMLYRLPEIPWRLSWILLVFCLSVGLGLAYDTYHIFRVALGLRPMTCRGASTTIGILPSPAPLERSTLSRKAQKKRLEELLNRLSPDPEDPRLNIQAIRTLADQQTSMAHLFWAVFSILDASKLPASPVKGSHGDTLLITHSLRVAASMAQLWEQASRPVMPTDVNKPVQSRPFDRDTAIIAGLAHDIGKVRCFRRGKDGTITVVGLHDMIGGRLIATLPEFWELRDKQGQHDDILQKLLTQAIRYYHHASAYPGSGFKRSMIHADEGIKALMLAIHDADMVAGSIEGRTNEILADYQDEDELPERDLAEQIWETFLMLMDDESMINSKSPQRRIAYKQGQILFLIENKIRTLICDHLSITRVDYTGNNNGNPGKIIQIIAARLDAEKWIRTEFNQRTCKKPWGAGFYIQIEGANKEGDATETLLKLPHYLIRITDDGPFAKYANMEDYPAKISLKAATWPQFFTKEPEKSEIEADSTTRTREKPVPQAQEAATSPGLESHAEQPPEQEPIADDHCPAATDQDAAEADLEDRDTPPEDPASTDDTPHDDAWDEDPFAGTEPSSEPVPEPATPETTQETIPDPTSSPSPAPDAEQLKAAQRSQLERARARANLSHETSSMIRREMDSPEQKSQKITQRTQYFLKTYPDILKTSPGRGDLHLNDADRTMALMGLIWMDQTRRDMQSLDTTQPPEDFLQVRLKSLFVKDLFQFPLEEKLAKVALKGISKLGEGRVLIMEMQTRLDIKHLPNGEIDLDNSSLFAPVQDEEQGDTPLG